MMVRRILVPVDFSECSARALQSALWLAERVGAAVTVLHVYEMPELARSSLTSNMGTAAGLLQQLDRDFAASAAKRMEELLSQHPAPPGVEVEQLVTRGKPWVQIVRAAEETAVDLIVIGTRGRTKFGRVLMGSVVSKVVRRAPCPVMSMRVPGLDQASAEERARKREAKREKRREKRRRRRQRQHADRLAEHDLESPPTGPPPDEAPGDAEATSAPPTSTDGPPAPTSADAPPTSSSLTDELPVSPATPPASTDEPPASPATRQPTSPDGEST